MKISKSNFKSAKSLSFSRGFLWGVVVMSIISVFLIKRENSELTELKKENLKLEILILKHQLR